jgi:hypothetical protein
MITQREISQLAYRLQMNDKVIEKDYVITWLLLALADSELKDVISFKGGTALKKIYFPEYRYSEDLDFTLAEEIDSDELIDKFENMLKKLAKDQAFEFALSRERIERRDNSITLFVNYRGPLQAVLSTRDIKVDFTISEKLIFPIEKKMIHSSYSDSDGIKKKITAYSLEEILTEKLCAIIGRTEPRDLYDANFLLGLGNIDYYLIPKAFKEKAEFKGYDPSRLMGLLDTRKSTFARMWDERLGLQIKNVPYLDDVLRELNRNLKKHLDL